MAPGLAAVGDAAGFAGAPAAAASFGNTRSGYPAPASGSAPRRSLLIGRILTAYSDFVGGRYREKFDELWPRYDCLAGRAVAVTQGDRVIAGTAQGIDADGSLLVRTAAGRTERFRAGEVTLAKG